jgi:hypothetical protein
MTLLAVATPRCAAGQPGPAQHSFEWAEIGETRLHEIRTNEQGEQEPEWRDEEPGGNREDDENAGEAPNDFVAAHDMPQKKVSVGSTAT